MYKTPIARVPFSAAMRAAVDERAAAAVEIHGLARLFGDGDVCTAGSGGCSTSSWQPPRGARS
eukprot:589673-Prymnesium_polylepis.1